MHVHVRNGFHEKKVFSDHHIIFMAITFWLGIHISRVFDFSFNSGAKRQAIFVFSLRNYEEIR